MSWGDVGELFEMGNWRDLVKEPLKCWIGLCEDMLNCPNQHTCNIYAQAWTLPYYYDHEGKCLYVCLGQAIEEIKRNTFEDIAPDLIKEWNALGFYMPMALQYERRPKELIVKWDVPGFALADPLPYGYIIQKSGYRALVVHYYITEDAKKAGYAPAVEIRLDEFKIRVA